MTALVVPGSAKVRAPGRGGGARPDLPRRRVRVAPRRLLDVPRHEPGHPRLPASAAPRRRTGTSRAARAAAAARTSSAPQMAAAAALHGHFVDVRTLDARGGDGMKALRSVTGRVAVLDRPDVDTDQIIPKQFLKRIERTGYGEFLFYDWRYDEDGNERPGFELNRPEFARRVDPARGAQLRLRLVARARRMGAAGLRLRRRHRAVVRRHLPHERREDRRRRDRASRRRR